MDFEDELAAILIATKHIQRALGELELHNERLSDITKSALGNSDLARPFRVSMKYRLQQVQLRRNDIDNAIEELKTQIGAIE